MKKLLILLACLLATFGACKKEPIIKIGSYYHIKPDVFNNGAYQPLQPVRIDSLYIDPTSGLPFAKCTASIDWTNFALSPRSGVAQSTIDRNKVQLQQLNQLGYAYGDTKTMQWETPQEDLKR